MKIEEPLERLFHSKSLSCHPHTTENLIIFTKGHVQGATNTALKIGPILQGLRNAATDHYGPQSFTIKEPDLLAVSPAASVLPGSQDATMALPDRRSSSCNRSPSALPWRSGPKRVTLLLPQTLLHPGPGFWSATTHRGA